MEREIFFLSRYLIHLWNLAQSECEKWIDKEGKQQERTEWFRVVAFGKLAEIAAKYLSKGSVAYVEGKLQTRSWENDAGETQYRTEVHARDITFLPGGSKKEEKESQADFGMGSGEIPF